jgi:hypothetical protein
VKSKKRDYKKPEQDEALREKVNWHLQNLKIYEIAKGN